MMFGRMRFSVLRLLVVAVVCAGSATVIPPSAAGSVPRGIPAPEAENLFSRGLGAYRSGHYQDAARQLQQLLRLPLNQRTTAALLLLARTQFHLGAYAKALATAQSIERRFSDSRYVPDARLVAGDCYYLLKRYYEAASQYARILATPATLAVQARAAERLGALAENGTINADALGRIRAQIGAHRMREALLYGRGRWYAHLGWAAESRAVMRTYADSVAGGIFAGLLTAGGVENGARDAAADTGRVSRRPVPPPRRPVGNGIPRLGLLLPVSGSGFARQVGEDLQAGVQLADEAAGEPFEVVVADIGMDYGDLPIVENESSRLLRVIQQTRRLIYEEGVVAIVGPVFSSDCVAAAVIADEAGVPLIAPLAQQSGLDQVGSTVFQLNRIPEVQARALAEYATLVLGLRTLAIISPLTDYGWSFEREFQRVAYDNGGNIVHTDWYVPEVTKDFRRIFEEIRKAGFALMPPPADTLATADSLAATVVDTAAGDSTSSFLGELLAGLDESGTKPEAPQEKDEKTAPPDSSKIFIDTIDGIVIVVEHFSDAQTIAPQLDYHRLTTQILGNDIWYDPEAIRQMRPADRAHLAGTVLVSGRVEGDRTTREFIDTFRRRFGRDPGYAAFGYDAARMLAQAWAAGQRTPADISSWLSHLEGFQGASGRISFTGGRRTNTELELLKIDARGRVRRVVERDLPTLAGESAPTEPGSGADLPRASLRPEELEGRE